MSVSDGQQGNAATFNSAFLSRTANSDTIGVVGLNNTTDPNSGAAITNAQEKINDNADRITQNESDISQNQADIATNASDITSLQASIKFSNYTAIVDPLPTDDDGSSYEVGSQWININNNRIFQCVDASTGAAIWKRIDKIMLKVNQFATIDFSSTSLTDAAYVELVADSGSETIRRIEEFYPAGSLCYLAIGAAASETDQYIIPAGGDSTVGLDVEIPPNSRISLKLVSGQTSVTSGVAAFNFLVEA